MSENISYNKIIEKLVDENEELKQKNDRLQKAHSNGWKVKDNVINKLEKEIVHLKECNLRYRNHNELLE